MYTLEAINEDYVREIYKTVVKYSLKKYSMLPNNIQEFMIKKYQHALKMADYLEIKDDKNVDELKNFLQVSKENIDQIKENNQPIIDLLVPQILTIFIQEMPNNLSDIEKCEYVFDFVTNTMEYSHDWFNYCNSVPPIDGFDFDFYHGIPVSNQYSGLLVTRQGICDDIANLITFLGRKIGLEIPKTTCQHNENKHSINYLIIDGNISYIDATSVILKNKNKEEAFLVSKELLNKDNDYILRENLDSKTIIKTPTTYDMASIINKTNLLMPTVNYTNITKLEK